MSVEFGYEFADDDADLPSFTTVPVDAPACAAGQAVALRVNVVTGVAGFLRIGVVGEPAMSAQHADPIKGNFMALRASWRLGAAWQVGRGAGETVALAVVGADASLYSISLVCEAAL